MMTTRLILAILLLVVAMSAQTSVSCSAVGYCGNSTVNAGTITSGNNDIVYGIPIVVTVGSLTISEAKVNGATGTGTIAAWIVCDSNTSGTTIGNSSPCPSNNVICSASTTFTASAANTVTLSGCGTLSTSARYWVFFNNNSSALQYTQTVTGSPVTAYFQASLTCCTAPSSVTGTVTSTSEQPTIGSTLASSGGPVIPRRLTIVN